MSDDALKRLGELLDEAGATIAFGLVKQGKFDIVTQLLNEGRTVTEIGRAIGWHGPTAMEFYAREAARRLWRPEEVSP
jgi:hypothetical protein